MLREFFVNEHPKFLFKQFGLIHNIFSILPVIGLIIIYLNRNKISAIPRKKVNLILKISAIILFLNMLIYTMGNLYYGSFDISKHLPFHLCFIANYLFMYGILFNKENILKYTIFLSFIGPIPAILWPDLVSTIDNFDFWQYVISHHFFICISLFSYYALNYKVEFKNFIKTFFLTNFLMLIMYPFNLRFHTNYIFSTAIPDNVLALYPWLKYFPPVLVLEAVGLTICLLIYNFLLKKRNKELKTMENNIDSVISYNKGGLVMKKYSTLQKVVIALDVVLLLAMIGIDLYVNLNDIGPSVWTQASDYIALIIMFFIPLIVEKTEEKKNKEENKKEEAKEKVVEDVVEKKTPAKKPTTKKTTTATKTATKKPTTKTTTAKKTTTTKKTTKKETK